MTWLVTGGAGYIGAHVVHALRQQDEPVVVLDDLSTGAADRVQGVELVVGSVGDAALVRRTLTEHDVSGVVHIAAKKSVGESVAQPLRYYRENVTGLQVLLEEMTAAGVDRMVFSSSAATYGLPDVDLVTEDTPLRPLSPYGETKVVGEWLMADAGRATGLRWTSLRYFNVAGAQEPWLGDQGVTNLIPLVFQALTERTPPRVFGADYPTPDGTCIRDYVHVGDIAEAHVAALLHLADQKGGAVYNIGRGEGASVLEVMRVVAEVTGLPVEPTVVDRRPGDPARIVASVERIAHDLGWTARRDLRDMVASGWEAWQAQHAPA